MDAVNEKRIIEAGELIEKARSEMGKRVVGQSDLVDGLLTGIIAGGHVLVEGVPGLAKTLAVRTLADVTSAMFKRIQFTPDLLPADLTGTMIYKQQTGEFVPRKGPVFSNVILADEINRAPAKVQSALLEAMAEGQVTIGEQTYPLPEPFFVMATQNPIEQEGTYRLPEAQLDRFLIKVNVAYPSPAEELAVLERMVDDPDIPLLRILDRDRVRSLREAAESVKAEESIKRYIVSLTAASRVKDRRKLPFSRYIEYGASPRATLAIYRCARVQALFEGRGFVLPEDVKAVAPMVMRHRLVLSYEAEAEQMDADAVIASLLAAVSVP
ncbi:MAG: AAA family ATPase [Spirochaetaceae bacterium]|nr:AAA family ATPase [Spirochaetaceae bacterium]MDT8297479.1 AAA family ATPase [Spirochaetaceae bacterium]